MDQFITLEEDNQILTRLRACAKISTPLLFIGPQQSGKKSYANYYSVQANNQSCIALSLQNAYDARDLFGGYVCGEVPGQFHFQPGVLLQSMVQGRTILIQNIDNLPVDVFSALDSVFIKLVQGEPQFKYLNQSYQISPDFRVVVTATSKAKFLKSSFLAHFVKIETAPFSENKIKQILYSIFRSEVYQDFAYDIFKICGLPIKVLLRFSRRVKFDAENGVAVFNAQFLKTKDMNALSQSLKQILIQEIYDCYLAQLQDFDALLQQLCFYFKLDLFQVKDSLLKAKYVCEINNSQGTVQAGRYNVKRLDNSSYFALSELKNFAMTPFTTRLIQQVVGCVNNRENVLLVSSTGIGKTYTLDIISKMMGKKMFVINFSVQTDIADLVGGFKPISINQLGQEFISLFLGFAKAKLDLNQPQNMSFISSISKFYDEKIFVKMVQVAKQFLKQFVGSTAFTEESNDYKSIMQINTLASQILKMQSQQFFFKFKEGALIQAVKEGHFILFDEINLGNTDVLDYLVQILNQQEISFNQYDDEKAQVTTLIQKHRDFRVFASMNPATDAGKKNLPIGLSQCFTTLNLQEMHEFLDLKILVESYLGNIYQNYNVVVEIFFKLKSLANNQLKSISAQIPTYTIRLLCRALKFSIRYHSSIGVERSLYEGLMLFFASNLDQVSYAIVNDQLQQSLSIKDKTKLFKPQLNEVTFISQRQDSFLVNVIDGLYFPTGPNFNKDQFDLTKPLIDQQKRFVITETNKNYIITLIKGLFSNTALLMEGVTSSGKSSLILFLADLLGYTVIRINNHENIDISDYLGTFQPDPLTGQLVFQYGPLIKAMKSGFWVILDELNLCSSEILESLNRLLDDNAEIYIPETNEYVKPTSGFALFATQNPSGLINGTFYGGRNKLSEAFKNRFIVMEIAEISEEELKYILSNRMGSNQLPQKFIVMLIQICQYLKLKMHHIMSGTNNDVVSQQITLRDLFRIADRLPDTIEEFSMTCFMLIGEKQRDVKLKQLVMETIRKFTLMNNFDEIFINKYYNDYSQQFQRLILNCKVKKYESYQKIVFTNSFQRLFVCTLKALEHRENPCLIGDCGSGKTQVAELCAYVLAREMVSINLHKNTDVTDFIGQLRPLRNRQELVQRLQDCQKNLDDTSCSETKQFYQKQIDSINQQLNQLFVWYDGPLVESMMKGNLLLIDEISLTNDSILERLNSVFETTKQLTIAEKPMTDNKVFQITANPSFYTVSTMNPGGDYGKKELSPALRNRMTEIYVSGIDDPNEVSQILEQRDKVCSVQYRILNSDVSVNFMLCQFFSLIKSLDKEYFLGKQFTFSIRDIISIYDHLISQFKNQQIIEISELIEVLKLCYLDGLRSRSQINEQQFHEISETVINQLYQVANIQQILHVQKKVQEIFVDQIGLHLNFNGKMIAVPPGPQFNIVKAQKLLLDYNLQAPSTFSNAFNVILAIINATRKPILLESSPGVGKTSLITQLSLICGYELIRINLSEHIDLCDLIGSDLPQETGFQFVFGPILRAVVNDSWLLLDELNLANQSVLEGINSLLDHRKYIYVPEINQTFTVGMNFRLFGAQNPYSQGGGRKQLPQSFLNRFMCSYLTELNMIDYNVICQSVKDYQVEALQLCNIINAFSCDCNKTFGHLGGPWEYNLRDIFRILDVLKNNKELSFKKAAKYFLISRFRCEEDIRYAEQLIDQFCLEKIQLHYPKLHYQSNYCICGDISLNCCDTLSKSKSSFFNCDLPLMEQSFVSIKQAIPLLFTTQTNQLDIADRVIKFVSDVTKNKLSVVSLSLSTDVSDLLGCYEQMNQVSLLNSFSEGLINYTNEIIQDQQLSARLSSIKQKHLFKKIVDLDDINQSYESILPSISQSFVDQYESLKILLKQQDQPHFMWQDGVVTQSVEQGCWLYIKNVNYCQPSVLDRLNSLLERDSCLYIYEQGEKQIRQVKVHQNFRIFLSYDALFGEVSRAIRNRCYEICLDNQQYIIENYFGKAKQCISFDKQRNIESFSLNNEITLLESIQCKNIIQLLENQCLNPEIPQLVQEICQFKIETVQNERMLEFLTLLRGDSDDQYFAYLLLQLINHKFILAAIAIQEAVHQNVQIQQIQQFKSIARISADQGLSGFKILLPLVKNSHDSFINEIQEIDYVSDERLQLVMKCMSALLTTDEFLMLLQIFRSNIINADGQKQLFFIFDKYIMKQEFSLFTQSLIYEQQHVTEDQMFNVVRRKLELNKMVLVQEQIQKALKTRESVSLDAKSFNYQQTDILHYLLFDQDQLHQACTTFAHQLHNAVLKSLLGNVSLMTGRIKQLSLLHNPVTSYVTQTFHRYAAISAGKIHPQISQLKEIFNLILAKNSALITGKFAFLNTNFAVARSIFAEMSIDIQLGDVNVRERPRILGVLQGNLYAFVRLLRLFTPENAFDPNQFCRLKIQVLEKMADKIQDELNSQDEQTVIMTSRVTKAKITNQSTVFFQNLVEQYRESIKEEEQLLVARVKEDDQFLAQLLDKLEILDVSWLESVQIGSQTQQTDFRRKVNQFSQNIQQLLLFLYNSNAEVVLSYADIVVPLLFCLTNIRTVAVFISKELEFNSQQQYADELLSCYYQASHPYQFYLFLKHLGADAENLFSRFIRQVLTSKTATVFKQELMPIDIIAQVASNFETDDRQSYLNYMNSYSLFRSRLQSKTGDNADDGADFELQLQQVFQDIDFDVQKIKKMQKVNFEKEEGEEEDQEDDLVPKQSLSKQQFVFFIGRVILDLYSNKQSSYYILTEENQALDYQLDYLKLLHLFGGKYQLNDEDFVVPILSIIKSLHMKLSSETTKSASMLAKIKSHTARRSQVCRNVYKNSYPAEVLQFMPQLDVVSSQTKKLLEEYPEDSRLLALIEIVKTLRQLPLLDTPLVKFMNLTEYLLSEIRAWNVNAPKSLSITESELKTSIVYWRRIELMSWNSFFGDVLNEQQDRALLSWPDLLLGFLTACRKTDFNQYSKQFEDQIRAFLLQEGIGQLSLRRDLLKAIANIPLDEVQYPKANQARASVLKIYYENVDREKKAQDHIQQEFSSLQDKFAKQVKLFQWDERDFDAVRASTRRAHAAVLRLLRKYNEILQLNLVNFAKICAKELPRIQESLLDDFIKTNKQVILDNTLNYDLHHNRRKKLDATLLELSELHKQTQTKNVLEAMLKTSFATIMDELSLSDFRPVFEESFNYDVPLALNLLGIEPRIMDVAKQFHRVLKQPHEDIQQADLERIKKLGYKLLQHYHTAIVSQYCAVNKSIIQQVSTEQRQLVFQVYQFVSTSSIKLHDILQQYLTTFPIDELSQLSQQVLLIVSQQQNNQSCDLDTCLRQLLTKFQYYLNNIASIKQLAPRMFDHLQQLVKQMINQINQFGVLSETLFYQSSTFQPIIQVSQPVSFEIAQVYTEQLLQILVIIVKTGYMAKQQSPEEQQQQQQDKGGVGLDDGQGENDITEQIEQENLDNDDLLGNDKDDRDDKDQEQQQDNDDKGIDMSQEFSGQDQNEQQQEEDQNEQDEIDRDMTDDDLSQASDLDKRAADQEEMNNDAEQEQEQKDQNEMNKQAANENQEDQNEEDNQDNDDNKSEQLNISYQEPDQAENFEDYNEKEDPNLSQQSEMNDDINLSQVFDDVFEEEMKQDDDQQQEDEPSQLEQKIEEVDQLFDEKNEEKQDEEELSTMQKEFEPNNDVDWQQDEDDKEKQQEQGFNNGNNDQQNSAAEEDSQEQEQQPQEDQEHNSNEKSEDENADDKKQTNKENNKEKLEQKEYDKRINKDMKKKERQKEQFELLENNDNTNGENKEEDENVQEKKAGAKDELLEDEQQRDTILQDQDKGETVKQEELEKKDTEDVDGAEQQGVVEGNQEPLALNKVETNAMLEEFYGVKIQRQAQILAERLKILLEPTQSSALVGDFRSGKKLNIRRVIPFVASGFRRDKIWLRRTKPQKRTYRVLLCVDNSFSVQNQQLQQQIIQSLLIIYQAAKTGELGKLGIASFGEEFKLIVPLLQAQNELQMLNAIKENVTFNERKSDFKLLLQETAKIFEEQNFIGNEASSGGRQNIMIVLTDGQVLDKHDVGSMYRHLVEDQKVIPMFLLYDPKIFDQVSVQFQTVNGQKKVVRKLYLQDEYPLQNFVVCESVETLTEVLCNAFIQILTQTV